jgi:hypothetical protein
MNTESFPSLSEQGRGLVKSSFEIVKDVVNLTTPTFVSEGKRKERLLICKECPYYSSKQSRCIKCGCFLEYKVKFEVSQCPIGKW